MKGPGALVASVLAASTMALSSSSSAADRRVSLLSNEGCKNRTKTTSEKEKFAPRFDGLRFIETLVTAHR